MITDPDNEETPYIKQVVYQGKRQEMGSFKFDSENPDCVIRKEGEINFGFRTDSKPREFYNILLSDIDVDCFIYKFTTR